MKLIFCKNSFLFFLLIVLIGLCGCNHVNERKASGKNDENIENTGVYILYKDKTTRVKYLSDEFEEIKDIYN